MEKLTIEDIRGYTSLLGYAMTTEEDMVIELNTWDVNTPIEKIRNNQYAHYDGQLLDVIFTMLKDLINKTRTYGKGRADYSGEVIIDKYTWGFPAKDGDKYYTGRFKDGTYPVVNLKDIPLEKYIDFVVYYLVDATGYTINNESMRDDHSYRVDSRFFQVGVVSNMLAKMGYFKLYKATKDEVSQCIVDKYIKQIELFYGRGSSKQGVIKLKRALKL